MCINEKCLDKKSAFKFVKILVSEDCQSATYDGLSPALFGTPINKRAYEDEKEYYVNANNGINMAHANNWGVFEKFDSVKLPKQLLSEFDNMFNKITAGDIVDEEVYKIIDEEVNQYLDGKKSAEQTAKAIDEKVTLFLNE